MLNETFSVIIKQRENRRTELANNKKEPLTYNIHFRFQELPKTFLDIDAKYPLGVAQSFLYSPD